MQFTVHKYYRTYEKKKTDLFSTRIRIAFACCVNVPFSFWRCVPLQWRTEWGWFSVGGSRPRHPEELWWGGGWSQGLKGGDQDGGKGIQEFKRKGRKRGRSSGRKRDQFVSDTLHLIHLIHIWSDESTSEMLDFQSLRWNRPLSPPQRHNFQHRFVSLLNFCQRDTGDKFQT